MEEKTEWQGQNESDRKRREVAELLVLPTIQEEQARRASLGEVEGRRFEERKKKERKKQERRKEEKKEKKKKERKKKIAVSSRVTFLGSSA